GPCVRAVHGLADQRHARRGHGRGALAAALRLRAVSALCRRSLARLSEDRPRAGPGPRPLRLRDAGNARGTMRAAADAAARLRSCRAPRESGESPELSRNCERGAPAELDATG